MNRNSMIGPLIKQVMDRLPPEKRKGYLLKPMPNLTYESMIQTILRRMALRRKCSRSNKTVCHSSNDFCKPVRADVRSELIKQNVNLFDEQFFALFSRLAQSAAGSGQEPVARAMVDLQKQLLEETEFGRGLKESVGELEAASKSLQDAGAGSHA